MTSGSSTQQRVAELRLRMKTEKQGITDAKTQLAGVQKQFRDFANESERTNRVLEQQAHALQAQQIAAKTSNAEIAKFATEERKAQTDAERATRAVDQQTKSLRAQYLEVKRLADAKRSSATGASASALAAFGREARLAVPAIPIPGTGIGSETLFRATEIAGRLGLNLKQLAVTGGLASVAIVGVSLAFSNFENTVNQITNLLKELNRIRQTTAGLLATGSPAEIVGRREDALKELSRLEAERTQAIQDTARQLGAARDSGALGNLLVNLQTTFGTGTLGGLIKNVSDLDVKIASAKNELSELDKVYAENIAAIEAERTAKERAALSDKLRLTTINLLAQASTLTVAEIDNRIRSLRDEQAAIQEFLNAGQGTPEFLAGLRQQLAVTGTEVSVLSYRLRPLIEQREKEAAAAQKLLSIFEGLPKAISAAADSIQRIKDAAQKITDVRTDFADKIRQIQNDLTDKIAEAEHDRDASILEARRDAGIAEAEAVRKAGLDRVEIERQSQVNIAKILRRSKADISRAIQDRDAVALDQARQRKQDDLQSEKENATERLQQLDTNLKEQLRTIDLRLKEQLRTIDIRYKDQLRVAQQAAAKSVKLAQERYQKELADAVKAYQAILQIELAKAQQTVAIAQNGAGGVLSVTANMFTALINQARTAQAAVTQKAATTRPYGPTPTNPNPINLPGIRVPTMASGGYVQQSGLAYLHAGERVVNPNRGQGGINISVNLNGMTKRRVLREIERQLDVYTEDLFA